MSIRFFAALLGLLLFIGLINSASALSASEHLTVQCSVNSTKGDTSLLHNYDPETGPIGFNLDLVPRTRDDTGPWDVLADSSAGYRSYSGERKYWPKSLLDSPNFSAIFEFCNEDINSVEIKSALLRLNQKKKLFYPVVKKNTAGLEQNYRSLQSSLLSCSYVVWEPAGDWLVSEFAYRSYCTSAYMEGYPDTISFVVLLFYALLNPGVGWQVLLVFLLVLVALSFLLKKVGYSLFEFFSPTKLKLGLAGIGFVVGIGLILIGSNPGVNPDWVVLPAFVGYLLGAVISLSQKAGRA